MMWQAVLCLLTIKMISKSSWSGSQIQEWVMQKWNASDSKLWVLALLLKKQTTFLHFLGVVLSHFISLGNTFLGTLSRMLLLTFSKQYFFLTVLVAILEVNHVCQVVCDFFYSDKFGKDFLFLKAKKQWLHMEFWCFSLWYFELRCMRVSWKKWHWPFLAPNYYY